jgi:hypothetical protein
MKDQLTALKTKYQRFYFRLCCDKYLPTLLHDYSNIVGSESFIWNVEISLGHLSVPILGAFACSREATAISVRPPACISAASTGRISVKFDTVDFYENLSIKSKFGYNLTKTSATLRVGQNIFYCCRPHKVAVKPFLTTMCMEQQYKRKVLLHFHSNND